LLLFVIFFSSKFGHRTASTFLNDCFLYFTLCVAFNKIIFIFETRQWKIIELRCEKRPTVWPPGLAVQLIIFFISLFYRFQ
jgi:hypothetical protein